MVVSWTRLSQLQRYEFQVAAAFLEGRFEEQDTVDWALGLDVGQNAERAAVIQILEHPKTRNLREPWRSVWALIEESWQQSSQRSKDRLDEYRIARRIRAGEKSGSLISSLVDLVRPIIEVKPLSKMYILERHRPKRPRRIDDIAYVSLSGGEVIDPDELGLDQVSGTQFLSELANELDAAVKKGLDIGRRLGWQGERARFWILGQLRRVYFVSEALRPPNEHEPDEFHHGIAPSVKLLYEVVSRLSDTERKTADSIIASWRTNGSSVHTRLWAAMARSPAVADSEEVASFLAELDASRFWDVNHYPEIAELRAVRFSELRPSDQSGILRRIRRGPPRRQWARQVDPERFDSVRRYWIVRELKRIELGGGSLPESDKDWLSQNQVDFDDLRDMSRIDEGFLGTMKARWVPPNPDNRLDLLEGSERLMALEEALSSGDDRWGEGPPGRAGDWIRAPGNAELVLKDLEATDDQGASFPLTWDRFGWSHEAPNKEVAECTPNLTSIARRVLNLLDRLSLSTASQAIEGITYWLSNWTTHTAGVEDVAKTWLRLWPTAVENTNAQQDEADKVNLNTVVQANNTEEVEDLDTLNTTAGRLVGVLLDLCPNLTDVAHPFQEDETLKRIRDTAIAASGRSGLIAQYRMIESLPWFLAADRTWTEEHLIEPLLADTLEAVSLWRAVARRVQHQGVLKHIGREMTKRANDSRLGRDARQVLVFNLVIQSLHALLRSNDPVVSDLDVQQMLRELDDEVRAHAADAIGRFVREMSAEHAGDGNEHFEPDSLFNDAAKPFLTKIWPQERSLSTPGVARALADLPASSGDAFAEAVNTIERFLVPFQCWALGEYGFRDFDDDESSLSQVDSREKAEALLVLLDRTIGETEGAVVPMDLGRALEHIKSQSPRIADQPEYRRLAALSRR